MSEQAATLPNESVSPAAGRLRGVIVEDEALTITLLERALAAAGYEVVGRAASGEEGVEVARQAAPDFILMDINMPGMGGIEATRQITANYPVPIVMLTAYNDMEHVDDAIAAGACAYVMKPVSSAQLVSAVKMALDSFEVGKRHR